MVARLVALSAADKLKSSLTKGRALLPALFISIATFTATQEARWAVLATMACGLLATGAGPRRTLKLGLTALAVCLVGWLGAIALPILAFVALWPALGVTSAMGCAATVLLAAEWSPKAVLVAASSMPSIASALGTMVAPALAALGLAAAAPHGTKVSALGRSLGFGLILGMSIWGLCEARWIGPDVLSEPAIRFALTFGFVVLCTSRPSQPLNEGRALPAALVALLLFSAAMVALVASRNVPASGVVFDEAHGDWASVSLSLSPNDFGRNTTYSWRALANLAEASGLRVGRATQAKHFERPAHEALYVLKMPVEAIEPDFARGLLEWVSEGGRLLVVADHTDLFDTAQNLNALLAALGARIAPTAVFDRLGQPPVTPRAHWSGATWLRASNDYRYLTGSSFEALPWSSLSVHTYGMSFAEQAVYFKANRFGYFQPNLAHPFGNHIAAAMLSHGRGSIQIWLDSTHWSTFTVFQSGYQDAFWQAIQRSAMVHAPRIYAAALAALSVLAAASFLWPRRSRALAAALAVVIGATIGAAASVRLVDASPAGTPRMVEAAIGSSASVELLTPIVESASRNYTRAFTSLQKWTSVRLHADARQVAAAPGGQVLFIDPSADDLPSASGIMEWVASGKRIVILSDPRILTVPEQQRWLGEVGFTLRTERGLSQERDASSDLLGRRQPAVVRHAVVRFGQLETSAWTETESTHLAQVFVLRPSSHRSINPAGALVLSARSEQFSDAAMGDVWEGVPVDDLSRSREHELARLVIGDQAAQMGGVAERAPRASLPSLLRLPDRFMVVSQGQLQAEGTLRTQSPGEELSFAETPDAFAWRLREDAAQFLSGCGLDSKSGYCSKTLVDSRLVEWLVVPRIDVAGRVVRLELIHEGRFSGVRDGMNVLFE